MNCDQVQRMMADYLGGELGSADHDPVQDHLLSCPSCRAEIESLQDVLGLLRKLPAGSSSGPAVDGSPVRVQTTSFTRFRVPRVLAYAAVLLLGVTIGWLVRPIDARTSAGPPPITGSEIPSRSRNEADYLDVPLVRNAVALSTAFSNHSIR